MTAWRGASGAGRGRNSAGQPPSSVRATAVWMGEGQPCFIRRVERNEAHGHVPEGGIHCQSTADFAVTSASCCHLLGVLAMRGSSALCAFEEVGNCMSGSVVRPFSSFALEEEASHLSCQDMSSIFIRLLQQSSCPMRCGARFSAHRSQPSIRSDSRVSFVNSSLHRVLKQGRAFSEPLFCCGGVGEGSCRGLLLPLEFVSSVGLTRWHSSNVFFYLHSATVRMSPV